ncbi:CoB--CoM heterodisulfide reductase subunit A [Cystobacter fuscus DSM 2262]|uniref:CoB--CoM heterodisulfide reductase subunit A n=1 Tax=Cystobacter fuscus (strain ATCC 25194 / DSM 2262 / NBRC 100088 / M29) TaxID=1242864 RepID=S9PKX9_CYSF2|nr:response regulator [Cystobacter fuscus]EPX63641.1 CoB--CoM heterodisulfide reductase subunit A [Cystobacter fuscus DSM 2262]
MDLPFETDESSGGEGGGGTLASTVLVVDDEPVVRDVCARLLAREPDLVVTLAEDAEQALMLLDSQRFDVLITDKNLPGMGGVELIAEARARQPSLEAVMITGYSSSESVIAAFAAGASDYILKPFEDLRLVRAKVRAALERRAGRVKGREQARRVAREAAELLQAGEQASPQARQQMESQLRAYELASRMSPGGQVAVVGSTEALRTLLEEGLEAVALPPDSPALLGAAVVVLETGAPDWWDIAERLQTASPDVVLLAGPHADLADLLDAITLRLELVGFGSSSPRALPERVRMLLMRRNLQRAQTNLASALMAFRESLARGGA